MRYTIQLMFFSGLLFLFSSGYGQETISRGEAGKSNPSNLERNVTPVKKKTIAAEQKVFFKTATKAGQEESIQVVNYQVNQNESNLNNYLNLIDYKNQIQIKGTPKAKQSAEFNQLNADIIHFKTQFFNEVKSKSLANMDKREQSYYLSMLKEDGNTEAYQNALQSLK